MLLLDFFLSININKLECKSYFLIIYFTKFNGININKLECKLFKYNIKVSVSAVLI